jgi:hypothetical protein
LETGEGPVEAEAGGLKTAVGELNPEMSLNMEKHRITMNLDRHILKLLKKRGSNFHKPIKVRQTAAAALSKNNEYLKMTP